MTERQELEEFEAADYLDHIGEHVEDWSYLKFPVFKTRKMGWPVVHIVGPGTIECGGKNQYPPGAKRIPQF